MRLQADTSLHDYDTEFYKFVKKVSYIKICTSITKSTDIINL
jgi:hypothetical protein